MYFSSLEKAAAKRWEKQIYVHTTTSINLNKQRKQPHVNYYTLCNNLILGNTIIHYDYNNYANQSMATPAFYRTLHCFLCARQV